MITVHAISPGARRSLPEHWIEVSGDVFVIRVPQDKDHFFYDGTEFLVRNDRLLIKDEEEHHLQNMLGLSISNAIAHANALRVHGYITHEVAAGLLMQLHDLRNGIKQLKKGGT